MSLKSDFDRIQLELPFTRLMRYDDMLVYSCGRDVNYAIQQANRIINDCGLNLIAEHNTTSAVLPNTLIIRKRNDKA